MYVRRNLTISFDSEFIEHMDNVRGRMSRGEYLEVDKAPDADEKALVARLTNEAMDGLTRADMFRRAGAQSSGVKKKGKR